MNVHLAKNFSDGYEAFSRVVQRENDFFHQVANPMKENTTPYREWQRGWEAAYFDNLEKLNGLRTRS